MRCEVLQRQYRIPKYRQEIVIDGVSELGQTLSVTVETIQVLSFI